MQGAEQGVMQGAEQGVMQGAGDTESGTEPGAEELVSPRGQRQKRWEMKQNRSTRLFRYLEPFPRIGGLHKY